MMVKELDIQVAREAPLGDPYAMPTLLAAVKMLDRFLRSGRIACGFVSKGVMEPTGKGVDWKPMCGWRTWDEAVTVRRRRERQVMPEFRDEQGDLIATDHFTDADGTHFVDGHAAPVAGLTARSLMSGKWVPLDATDIPADGKKRVVIVADRGGDCRLLSAGQRVIQMSFR